MSGAHSSGFAALFLPLFLMAGIQDCSVDDSPPKRHPSPKAVFDSYREARARLDWRTCFSHLTREVQDDVIFETYFSCSIKDSKETNSVLKRFGVDWETLTSDARREYKAKHGVELADDKVLWGALEKDYKAEHEVPLYSSHDLLSDILSRQLKDKAGFFEAANNVLPTSHTPLPIGDLERVVVREDTATGHAAMTLPVAHGQKPGSKGTNDKTFHFRKLNGGWLLDSL